MFLWVAEASCLATARRRERGSSDPALPAREVGCERDSLFSRAQIPAKITATPWPQSMALKHMYENAILS